MTMLSRIGANLIRNTNKSLSNNSHLGKLPNNTQVRYFRNFMREFDRVCTEHVQNRLDENRLSDYFEHTIKLNFRSLDPHNDFFERLGNFISSAHSVGKITAKLGILLALCNMHNKPDENPKLFKTVFQFYAAPYAGCLIIPGTIIGVGMTVLGLNK